MVSTGINLVMTVIGFAFSALFIVFVCTRLICARIQLRYSRRAFPDASRSDFNLLERGFRGLEPIVVDGFPTKKYGDQIFSSGQDIQCTVCLAEYHEKDILRILPFCGHAFHVACIDIWLKQHSTCPVCRISLRDSPERKHVMQPVYSPAIRSNSAEETFISDLHQYHITGYSQGLPPESQRTVNSEENLIIPEPSEAKETSHSWADVNPVENVSNYQGKGKHLESPSYS